MTIPVGGELRDNREGIIIADIGEETNKAVDEFYLDLEAVIKHAMARGKSGAKMNSISTEPKDTEEK